MTEINTNPAAPPVDNQIPGQPAGGNPSGDQTPPAAGNDQPSGGATTSGDVVSLSAKELRSLQGKANRWEAYQKRNRNDRRSNRRRSTDDYNADDADPALLDALKDRDTKIDELSSVNVKLAVKDQVRDLLDSDEYKDLPVGIKRAITRNPLGFSSPSAQTVEDAVADIQDYLDDELDRMTVSPPAQGGGQPAPAGTPPSQTPISSPPTPPASGSGPSNPQIDVNQGIDGKIGSKRSTQVLQNILKGPKR